MSTPRGSALDLEVGGLAWRHKLPVAKSRAFVREMFELIANSVLEADEKFRTPIGIFYRSTTKPRVIRNPATGEPMTLPATHRLGFRAARSQKGRGR